MNLHQKIISCFFALTLITLSCNDTESPSCDTNISEVGIIPQSCFQQTTLMQDFYLFRSGETFDMDPNQDGVTDFSIRIVNESYGIAGPPRDQVEFIPANENIEVAITFIESLYCTRFYASEDDPFYGFVDSQPCEYYTDEEIAEVDTVLVEDYGADLVQIFHQAASITDTLRWTNNPVFIRNRPKQQGGIFDQDNKGYILFRMHTPNGTKFGWLHLQLERGYDTSGTYISLGIDQ